MDDNSKAPKSTKRTRKSKEFTYRDEWDEKETYKSARTTGTVSFVPATIRTFDTKLAILPSVALSEFDKASQLRLTENQLACHGCEGSYYWEIEILPSIEGETGHIRVGWSTRQGELQAPVGFDKYSYAYRDICGSKVHDSLRIDNYGDSFGVGDIIGCYISLDDVNIITNKIIFFKNGISQGIAYSGNEIPPGLYIPSISLYMKANVRVNFGPTFIKRHDILGANAMSELQPMNSEDRKVHEQRIADIRRSRGEA
eukprot:gene12200-16343_t